MLIIVLAAVAIAVVVLYAQKRESARVRALAVERIEAFHASAQDAACRSRLNFCDGQDDPGYYAVHDPKTGRSLAMTRFGGRGMLKPKWWVLYEEYPPGAAAHLADRLVRHTAVIPDRHPAAAKLRAFVELAQWTEAPLPKAAGPIIIDPFELPSDS